MIYLLEEAISQVQRLPDLEQERIKSTCNNPKGKLILEFKYKELY